MSRLAEQYEYLAASFGGKVSYLCVDMDTYDENRIIAAQGEMEPVVSASTIKVPIMMAVLEKCRKGELTLESEIPVPAEQILEDTQVFEYGARNATVYELLVWMIVNSDNTATNVLISYMGIEQLNQYFKASELKETRLERKMLDFAAVENGRNNYISPMDFYRCMKKLQDAIHTDDLSHLAMNILRRNRDHDALCRYLFEDISVAHKSGGLDDIVHDAGILEYNNKRFFLGVFISEFEPGKEQERESEKLIGRMARILIDELR